MLRIPTLANPITWQARQSLSFTLCAGVYCLSTLAGHYSFNWLVKILPIAMLLFYSLRQLGASYRFFSCGLAFSLLGDVLLAIENGDLFVFGLGAFLIAHLFYIRSFMPICKRPDLSRLFAQVLYLTLGGLVFALLWPHLGELRLPVAVYMLVLLAMAMISLLSRQSNRWLILGAACFVLSDSLIGIDKFYAPLPQASLMIMLTYYAAQFFLFKGMLQRSTLSPT